MGPRFGETLGMLIHLFNNVSRFPGATTDIGDCRFHYGLATVSQPKGPLEEIRSDRGTNFVGAERELKEAIRGWNNTKIYQELQQKGVKWTFHPPTAAHMSGIWERLVQSAKKHLKAVVGNRLLSEFALRTLFTEVEFITNNRPIVAASDDPTDLEALTPNHFLLQRKVTGLPPGVFVREDHLGRKQ